MPRQTRAVILTCLLLLACGCDKIIATTDSQRILGKWTSSIDSIEFFSNGDFRDYAILATHSGKWTILEGNRVQWKMDSAFLPDSEWKYAIDGEKLTLSTLDGGASIEYKRAQ